MITAGSAPFVFCQQRLDVQFVRYTIDHPHQMMFGDQFVQSRRQQIHLLHAIGFEGDLSFVHAPFILDFHPFEEGLSIPFLDSPSYSFYFHTAFCLRSGRLTTQFYTALLVPYSHHLHTFSHKHRDSQQNQQSKQNSAK